MQNKCNKWIKYKKLMTYHKNSTMGRDTIEQSTEIHLHDADMRDIQILNSIIKECFLYGIKRMNMELYAYRYHSKEH